MRSSSSVVVAVVLVRASGNSEAEGAFDLDAIPVERFGARFTTATSAQPERRGSFVSTGESQAPWIRELAMMGSLGYGRNRRVLGGACGVFGMHRETSVQSGARHLQAPADSVVSKYSVVAKCPGSPAFSVHSARHSGWRASTTPSGAAREQRDGMRRPRPFAGAARGVLVYLAESHQPAFSEVRS